MRYNFEINTGDYVKFKRFKKDTSDDIYYGKVVDIDRTDYVGIQLDSNDKRFDYPLGLNIYIDRKQILQVFPSNIVEHLTPRLALKHLWKNFIFREVKTSKFSGLLHVEYRYISKVGFERAKRFRSVEEAYKNISFDYHRNIVPCYEDYYGFTTEKAVRNNDIYYDKEIFFSKKCYSELDWGKNPTGDFSNKKRSFNDELPKSGQLICGIVEHGEKGLFFRKWFVCSREFLTLWTMICEPTDLSLTETPIISFFDSNNKDWNKIEKSKRKVKEFSKLLDELDTSHYSIDLNLDITERRKKYLTHNLEKAALYFPNKYKQVAEIVFSSGFFIRSENNSSNYSDDFNENETKFQKKLIENLLWPKFFLE